MAYTAWDALTVCCTDGTGTFLLQRAGCLRFRRWQDSCFYHCVNVTCFMDGITVAIRAMDNSILRTKRMRLGLIVLLETSFLEFLTNASPHSSITACTGSYSRLIKVPHLWPYHFIVMSKWSWGRRLHETEASCTGFKLKRSTREWILLVGHHIRLR